MKLEARDASVMSRLYLPRTESSGIPARSEPVPIHADRRSLMPTSLGVGVDVVGLVFDSVPLFPSRLVL